MAGKPTIQNLILSLTLLSLSTSQVTADEQLVRIVCRETDQPALCVQCLSSDPGADLGSKAGIAASVIDCLKGGGTTLGADMLAIAASFKDEHGKRIFEACSVSYVASNKDLAAASVLVKSGKYDSAEKAVASALSRQDSCVDSLDDYKKAKLESKVAYKMRVYDGLCKAVERIIERL